MLFTCYCANSREIASPQVNWSEANDNVRACEIVTSSIFFNAAPFGHECAKRERRARRLRLRTVCEGPVGLNKPGSKWTGQIILLKFENCNWKNCNECTEERASAGSENIGCDCGRKRSGVSVRKFLCTGTGPVFSLFPKTLCTVASTKVPKSQPRM